MGCHIFSVLFQCFFILILITIDSVKFPKGTLLETHPLLQGPKEKSVKQHQLCDKCDWAGERSALLKHIKVG